MEKHYVMKTEKQAIAKAKAELRKEMGRRLFSITVTQNRNSFCTCGETLGKIAYRYGISVKHLAKLNRISTKAKLKKGQRLRIR